MTPMKLNVFFAFFPYGGNGGTSSEHPALRDWFAATLLAAKADERVGEVSSRDFNDTPITMTRNLAVRVARQRRADVLVMCDSDQLPDAELGEDPQARPFWQTSFDFLYERRLRGLITVVAAPYCGPPPVENVYVFHWANMMNDSAQPDMRLEAYSRQEASRLGGIQPAAALPTGLVMFDTMAFDLGAQPRPYFYYEYTDGYETEKASTEDVTATRDISMLCHAERGYSPVFCNWDAWAGHYKPKAVRKPRIIGVNQVGQAYVEAVRRNIDTRVRRVDVKPTGRLAEILAARAGNGVA